MVRARLWIEEIENETPLFLFIIKSYTEYNKAKAKAKKKRKIHSEP